MKLARDTAVEVIRDSGRATTLLQHPLRLRVLEALEQPASASGIARVLGEPRQRVNYHLRELEKAGFVEFAGERPRRGLTERLLRATATTYLVSPEALGRLGTESAVVKDRFSWAYLVAVAARTIRDLGILRARADAVQKRLATLTLETEVRFASSADRDAFADELRHTVTELAARYHRPRAAHGRLFRLFLGAYPAITKTDAEAAREASGGSTS